MNLPSHHEDYTVATACALACGTFTPDDEEEWVADDPRSCFNCLNRRWTASAITCMKDNAAK